MGSQKATLECLFGIGSAADTLMGRTMKNANDIDTYVALMKIVFQRFSTILLTCGIALSESNGVI